MTLAVALAAFAVSTGAQPSSAPAGTTMSVAEKPYSFVVLGHLRGDVTGPNPKLGELLHKVRALRPAFAVLTGDLIWGEVETNPSDKAVLVRDWTVLDSALATLNMPIYRVPGNHDINDVATRDVYRQRYGLLPKAVTIGTTRLLLLASPWVPSDTDSRKMPFFRSKALDAAHLSFLRTELAKPGFAHTFVAMHDLIWWQPDSTQWWREVQPMLRNAKVDAVFSGDLGPLKFSTTTRDGVRYFQSAMETKPSVEILRDLAASRILSAQFDNFLEVRVNGPAVDVVVHTLAEVSSGMFTPELYRQVIIPPKPRPPTSSLQLAWDAINSPKRLTGLAVVLGLGAFMLMYTGFRIGRRPR